MHSEGDRLMADNFMLSGTGIVWMQYVVLLNWIGPKLLEQSRKEMSVLVRLSQLDTI